jgi:hypothetical protein
VLLVALVMVMLAISALVIDLARLRQDRSDNRAVTDLASSAGALTLSEGTSPDMVAACTTTWDYIRANVADIPAGAAPNCSTFSTACSPSTARTATGSSGQYTVSITNPVPDGDPLLQPDAIGAASQAANSAVDGTACQRIAVRIGESRDYAFARFVGLGTSQTTATSVARAKQGTKDAEPIALLLLETVACNALVTSGQAAVWVKATVSSLGVERPGGIRVESAGTGGSGSNNCNNGSRWTIDNGSTSNGFIRAEATSNGQLGVIRSYALSALGNPAKAYDPNDLSTGTLDPVPTPVSSRVGRTPIDARYNCKLAGQDNVAGTDDDCATGVAGVTDRVDQLIAQLGSAGVPGPGRYGSGWSTYPGLGQSCNVGVGTTVTLATGNWYFNCPGGLNVQGSFTTTGGNVVSSGGLTTASAGRLVLNSSGADDSVVFVRNGNITKGAQSSIQINRSTVYLANGVISMGAGSGALTWSAPCPDNKKPCTSAAGIDFEDLALWSESANAQGLGGQAALDVDGIFFMPRSPFTFTGQGGLALVGAQFVARTMTVKGQGTLAMAPDPDRIVLIPIAGVQLIR